MAESLRPAMCLENLTSFALALKHPKKALLIKPILSHKKTKLQEETLSSQYLAAVGAHFMYWASPEVAAFVYKAVHGYEVLAGGFSSSTGVATAGGKLPPVMKAAGTDSVAAAAPPATVEKSTGKSMFRFA